MRPSLLLLISCSLLACKPVEKDRSASNDPVASAEQPTTDAAKPAAKRPSAETAPKPKPEEAAKLRKRLLTLLNEGRALTKKGDHAGGIVKYREALEIDASDVSVLGELGWAAYLAGDLELAHRTTVQALKFVRDDGRRGMLLYNLGRIEEDREQLAAAIDHYRASLAARPGNKTVEARLSKLEATQDAMAIAGSAGGELQGPDRPGLAPLARDLPDLVAACKIVEQKRCEDFTLFEDDRCVCEPTLLATPGVDQSWGLLQLGGDGIQVAWFPAVQTDKGWTVFAEVLYTYNPGAFGIWEEEDIGTSTVESLLAKGTQLVMRVSKSRSDRDMGINEIAAEGHSALIICARHETGAYCTHPLITFYVYGREVEFPGEDMEIIGEEIDHEGLPFEHGFKAEIQLVDGKIVATWTEVTGGFHHEEKVWGAIGRVLPAGEHSIAELLGLPE